MKSKLLDIIKTKYDKNELFFLSDLSDKSYSEFALKQELLRLTKEGSVNRYSYGVYYLPDPKKDEKPSPIDAIEKRYISKGKEVYGFYTGDNFIASIVGHDPSESTHIEIMTNRATSGKKNVYMFSKRFILRKPYFTITRLNAPLNAFLSYVCMAPILDVKDNYAILANYIRQEHLSASDVMDCMKFMPAKTSSKLLASDLYRSLWKH